jgi:site-specific DNA-methyltransferase (adenine-specific)
MKIKEESMSKIDLRQGDCLELMKDIPDGSIDMILCDLPYGTTACKWDVIIPIEPLWEQYKRIVKDSGAIVLFGTEPFSSKLRLSNLKMYRYDIIWEKERPTNIFFMKKQIGKVHENISLFYRKQPSYNPIMVERKSNNESKRDLLLYKNNGSKTHKKQTYRYSKTYKDDYRYPRSVIKINREKSVHPTQKPVALLEYLIKTYTNESELVLDNCMGSGSTGVACQNLNRNFIGIELDAGYFEIAKKRIEEEQL